MRCGPFKLSDWKGKGRSTVREKKKKIGSLRFAVNKAGADSRIVHPVSKIEAFFVSIVQIPGCMNQEIFFMDETG